MIEVFSLIFFLQLVYHIYDAMQIACQLGGPNLVLIPASKLLLSAPAPQPSDPKGKSVFHSLSLVLYSKVLMDTLWFRHLRIQVMRVLQLDGDPKIP